MVRKAQACEGSFGPKHGFVDSILMPLKQQTIKG